MLTRVELSSFIPVLPSRLSGKAGLKFKRDALPPPASMSELARDRHHDLKESSLQISTLTGIHSIAFMQNKPSQPGRASLTSCPGYCHLKFTSTSGSPSTVQITCTLSLTSALLDDAAIVVEGGPLGTERQCLEAEN